MKPVSSEEYDKALDEINEKSMKIADLSREIVEQQQILREKLDKRFTLIDEGEALLTKFKNLVVYH